MTDEIISGSSPLARTWSHSGSIPVRTLQYLLCARAPRRCRRHLRPATEAAVRAFQQGGRAVDGVVRPGDVDGADRHGPPGKPRRGRPRSRGAVSVPQPVRRPQQGPGGRPHPRAQDRRRRARLPAGPAHGHDRRSTASSAPSPGTPSSAGCCPADHDLSSLPTYGCTAGRGPPTDSESVVPRQSAEPRSRPAYGGARHHPRPRLAGRPARARLVGRTPGLALHAWRSGWTTAG